MKKIRDVKFYKFEQLPSWNSLLVFVEKWNSENKCQFENISQIALKIVFETGRTEESKEFEKLQDKFLTQENKVKYKWHLSSYSIYEDADYEESSFISFLGHSLPVGFLLNENQALTASKPCTKCGYSDQHSRQQIEPLIINVAILNEIVDQDYKKIVKKIDFFNLPNGGLMISKRVVEIIMKSCAEGFQLKEVMSNITSKPIDDYFQLIADKAIFVPCNEHTILMGGEVCSFCGTYYGQLQSEVFYRSSWVSNIDFFSEHPNCMAAISCSNRIYKKLKISNLAGFYPVKPISLCNH